jgi:enoyl-CoA hydratase
MTEDTSPVLIERPEPNLAVIYLNRPTQYNAFDLQSLAVLDRAIEDVSSDDSVRVVVLTGNGKAFCAGLDLKSILDQEGKFLLDVTAAYKLQERFEGIVRRLRASSKTVIAAVNGAAVGAGFALTMAADIRLACPAASFHVGAVRIGITAGECGISYHLPRLIGASRAFEVMLTGRPIDAVEAERIGLVARIVESDQIHQQALVCAAQVLRNSPYATKHTKRIMWANLDASSLDAAIELENHAQVLGLMTSDFAEGALAFVEKRPARFTGS